VKNGANRLTMSQWAITKKKKKREREQKKKKREKRIEWDD
jgi:hypothetical protein